ncbi:unnamed protein product [Peronospora destructor]|uniref:DHHA2 domain-containing protein n=1 Tax=Peronospora destructor TaxID=86335 RepID=A0AAV0UYU2_9STRA|nr:unnamed protein product [Peronospora destructor]
MTVTVAIVDDHHHCLRDIHLAIRQRRLPFSDIHVVHVDAHPDLSFPTAIELNAIFNPDMLYNILDDSVAGIAEFLLPLVYAGHVTQITWLKPSWSTQMPIETLKQLVAGKRKTNGTLGVTSELSYFVENDLFCPVENLDASSLRYWDLFVTEINSSVCAAAVAIEAVANARHHSSSYILDIDLDYFSTWNPFRKGLEALIGEVAVKTVTQFFSCVRYKRDPLEVIAATHRSSERKTFCELVKRLETADAMENTITRRSEWAQVRSKIISLYEDDVDAEKLLDEFDQVLEDRRVDKAARREIWAAGPFLDLPHHESSQDDIECMVSQLEQFLLAHALDENNPPAIVTIAKSTADEFLPPYQLDALLPSVLRMLERLYGEVAVQSVEYESRGRCE